MAKRRPKETRERITDTLYRVAKVNDSYFPFLFSFTGLFETMCPRCQKTVAIIGATIWLDLSCGCSWHPPDKQRGKEEWTCYSKEAA